MYKVKLVNDIPTHNLPIILQPAMDVWTTGITSCSSPSNTLSWREENMLILRNVPWGHSADITLILPPLNQTNLTSLFCDQFGNFLRLLFIYDPITPHQFCPGLATQEMYTKLVPLGLESCFWYILGGVQIHF